MKMRFPSILVCMVFLGGLSRAAFAQQLMGFQATGADYCGMADGTFIRGYQEDTLDWGLYGPNVSYLSIPNGYVAWSWTLSDQLGTMATGSYDSRTGVSIGGTNVSSAGFTAPRAPVGGLSNMSFVADISVYAMGFGGPCMESVQDTTTNTISSGGTWFYWNDQNSSPKVGSALQTSAFFQQFPADSTPEPSTILYLATGTLILLGLLRRVKRYKRGMGGARYPII